MAGNVCLISLGISKIRLLTYASSDLRIDESLSNYDTYCSTCFLVILIVIWIVPHVHGAPDHKCAYHYGPSPPAMKRKNLPTLRMPANDAKSALVLIITAEFGSMMSRLFWSHLGTIHPHYIDKFRSDILVSYTKRQTRLIRSCASFNRRTKIVRVRVMPRKIRNILKAC